MESGLRPGKSWKIKEMIARFLTHVHVFEPLHTLSLFSVRHTCARLTTHSVYLTTVLERRGKWT